MELTNTCVGKGETWDSGVSGPPPLGGWETYEIRELLTPFHCDGARQAGVLHVASIDLSTLRNYFKHHHDLEGPVSVRDQACGDHPSLLFLAVPEPPDLNVAWVEAIHRADQEVVLP